MRPANTAFKTVSDQAIVDEEIAKLESQKRWPELLRALADKAEQSEGKDGAQHYRRIGDIYMQRFSNHTEALRAYRLAFARDPSNRSLFDTIRESLEKRRDWQELARLWESAECASSDEITTEVERLQKHLATRSPLGPVVVLLVVIGLVVSYVAIAL